MRDGFQVTAVVESGMVRFTMSWEDEAWLLTPGEAAAIITVLSEAMSDAIEEAKP